MSHRILLLCACFGLAGQALASDPVFDQRVPPPTQEISGDRFGSAVAASNNRAFVSRPFHADPNTAFTEAGLVYVQEPTPGGNWVTTAVLQGANTESLDRFGDVIAVSGNTLVVGAPFEDSDPVTGVPNDNSSSDAGAAYVFVRNAGVWQQQAFLKAGIAGDLRFGQRVTVQGDKIAVAGLSNIYLYQRVGTTWSNIVTLPVASGPTALNWSDSGNQVAAGFAGAGPNQEGEVRVWGPVLLGGFIFWLELALITPPSSGSFDTDRFGQSLFMSDEFLFVGAPRSEDPNDLLSIETGAVHVYENFAWTQEIAVLTPSNGEGMDQFGWDIDWDGSTLLVGAPGEDSADQGVGTGQVQSDFAFSSGAAYAFEQTGPQSWSQTHYLKGNVFAEPTLNDNNGAQFGLSVAACPELYVVGAPSEDTFLNWPSLDPADVIYWTGASYYFSRPTRPTIYCIAKASSDGCLAKISTNDLVRQPVTGDGGYTVTASDVQSFKNGRVFVSISGRAELPFNGGTLCIQPPTKRGPAINSGGVNGSPCSGSFSTEINNGVIVPAGLDAGPGQSAWYQYWFRDPANGAGSLGTGLSNAIELCFVP